ncbi:MAG TPA: nucleotidyl transferase AbiEii/AbiGii toxin family protein [Kofleriaceae bacterium]
MNPDFAEILSALSAAGAEYIVVGAFAVAAHGNPRATGDIDIWVRPTRENAERVLQALRAFGAPLFDLTIDDLVDEQTVFQIGVAPVRIDILAGIDGVEFEDAWPRRLMAALGNESAPVLSLVDLAANKRAAGRPKDLVDLAWIESELEKSR